MGTLTWWEKWLLEIVTFVEPWVISMRPSVQRVREQWSIQIFEEPKMVMASPPNPILRSTWWGLVLTRPFTSAVLHWRIWIPWIITYLTLFKLMHGPFTISTFTPLPSIVLKLFTKSLFLNVSTMSLLNMIQSGLDWITPYRSVPRFGNSGPSEGSVTT